jgi:hypothetical protein
VDSGGREKFGADSVLARVSRMRAERRPGESDFDEWIYLDAAPIKAVRVSART